jgi:creatinine amidohydrolase
MMRQAFAGLAAAVAVTGLVGAQAPRDARPVAPVEPVKSGVVLGDLTWPEAEKTLTDSSVVVIPLGLATEQHGPHLRLNNKERLARYLAGRVQAAAPVVIAPALTYHFSPTFLEYPGSTSLSRTTARDVTVDIARSLAKYGPRRFYVLNTESSAMSALGDAARALADDGVLLGYTDMGWRLANAAVHHDQTPTRSAAHADEIETSMMLFVDPSAVDMKKAVREYGAGAGAMTRQKDAQGTFSATGVYGDPTLATAEKGRVLVEAVVAGALDDIEKIRAAPLPEAKKATPPPAPPRPARPAPSRQQEIDERAVNGCTALEDRAIRNIGPRFSVLWKQMDAESISLMFTDMGDMRHPDGTIERGQQIIRANRQELFNKKEYRGSSHPLTLNDIRCVTPGVAIADGKWELRLVDPAGTSGPTGPGRGLAPDRYNTGWCTLILVGGGGNWRIEAWRYTVDPMNGLPPPTTLKQPGFIRGGGGQ